jgi:hypothetical protein
MYVLFTGWISRRCRLQGWLLEVVLLTMLRLLSGSLLAV